MDMIINENGQNCCSAVFEKTAMNKEDVSYTVVR